MQKIIEKINYLYGMITVSSDREIDITINNGKFFNRLCEIIADLKKMADKEYEKVIPCVLSKKTFKVGWIYKDGYDREILITHIWKDGRDYPIIGSSLNDEFGSTYTLRGYYLIFYPHQLADLILESGRPYDN